MSFETLLFLGFLWFLFSVLRRGGVGRPTSRKRGPTPLPPPPPAPPSTEPTQREGHRLEALLGDLQRGLDEVARTKRAETASRPAPERGTVKTISLETEVRRPERAVVDQDDSAAQVAAQRIAQAEARSGPLTAADYERFERQIRQEPADHTAVRSRYTGRQLKDAVVWREILGPPVALRGEELDVG